MEGEEFIGDTESSDEEVEGDSPYGDMDDDEVLDNIKSHLRDMMKNKLGKGIESTNFLPQYSNPYDKAAQIACARLGIDVDDDDDPMERRRPMVEDDSDVSFLDWSAAEENEDDDSILSDNNNPMIEAEAQYVRMKGQKRKFTRTKKKASAGTTTKKSNTTTNNKKQPVNKNWKNNLGLVNSAAAKRRKLKKYAVNSDSDSERRMSKGAKKVSSDSEFLPDDDDDDDELVIKPRAAIKSKKKREEVEDFPPGRGPPMSATQQLDANVKQQFNKLKNPITKLQEASRSFSAFAYTEQAPKKGLFRAIPQLHFLAGSSAEVSHLKDLFPSNEELEVLVHRDFASFSAAIFNIE